ncbi:long-chain fatty acid--CoA ligase [Longimicrobium sp.]|uniref:class I adenylate-forming enzyme family protein n=1 Tax=Longimicrobium sp. TaxID=2029185 RepID=UPI002CB8143F|nr:long-chain fatty acid--CoA ligase [Longimicrobium sp.]HSU13995.1 long-chain fatty acid--CoA ligase [Longimicrobium sp.]
MNVAQNLERSARLFPGHTAIVFEGRALTYAELEAGASRAAHGLQALGVAAGDRVALFLPNIPEFAVAYLAAQKLGAVAVSVNALLKTDELRYVLGDSGAAVVFTTALLLPELAPLRGELAALRDAVVCEGEAPGERTLGGLCDGRPDRFRAREMERDDPAAILYTSGTTGKQKGAVLSHGNVVSNYHATCHCVGSRPGDRHALFLPLFHCFGQDFILNAALHSGGTVLLHRRFDPQATPALLREQGMTHLYAVPTIYIYLLNAGITPADMPALRYCFSAAATMPVEVARRWRDVFDLPVFEGYGLTETSPFAAYNHEYAHRPGSIGTPIENVEMRVVGADDGEVADGEWGEICIRGPNVMLGYFGRPADSAEALRGGWFHTGDVGYRDADGFFWLVDRVKDMINAAGFKVWPREVEEVLYTHPAVKECAVVGIPDEVKGEAVAAFVILQAAASATAGDVEAFCRERMAAYKVPRQVHIVDSIPKSPTGKILKRMLREE